MEHETRSDRAESPAQAGEMAEVGGNEALGGNEVVGPGADQVRHREEAGEDAATVPAATVPGTTAAGAVGAADGEPGSEPDTRLTGEPRVDAALRLLDQLPGLPVSEHRRLFEQVHAQLSDVLGELDPGTGLTGQ